MIQHEEDYIKFYKGNGTSSFYTNKALDFVRNNHNYCDIGNINDMLQLYNVNKYLKPMGPECQDIVKSIKRAISQYINSTNILDALKKEDVMYQYKNDILECLLAFCSLDQLIPEKDFKMLLSAHKILLRQTMGIKKVVNMYAGAIKEVFLSDPRNFELFINKYMANAGKLYLPNNITKEELLILCERYIESENVDPNYLNFIMQPPKDIMQHISVPPNIQAMAKRRQKQYWEHARQDGQIIESNIPLLVATDKETYEKESAKHSRDGRVYFIEKAWIDNNLDFPTLGNNFRYLYGLFTGDLLSTLPSYPNVETGFADNLRLHSGNMYPDTGEFYFKQNSTIMKFRCVDKILGQHDISIEDILNWFFNTYCPEEYDVTWLDISAPKYTIQTKEKTTLLFVMEENIRKQYNILVQNDYIDKDILDYAYTPGFSELGSFSKCKFLYPNDKYDMSICRQFFSRCSTVFYDLDIRYGEESFIEYMRNHDLRTIDFSPERSEWINKFIKYGLLSNDLSLGDSRIVIMHQMLYEKGVIGLTNVHPSICASIKRGEYDNILKCGSTLFAKPEIDYLNFMLNKIDFDNSKGIRNRYLHGVAETDEQALLADYYIALAILITEMIKIDDELSTRKVLMGGQAPTARLSI